MICVGMIVEAHGVRGLIRVQPLTSVADRFSVGAKFKLEPPEKSTIKKLAPLTIPNELTFLHISNHAKGLILVQTEEILDRDLALALRGYKLMILETETAASEDDDTFFYYQLIDLDVYYQDKKFGSIIMIEEYGAAPLLLIKDISGREIYIPFTKSNVPEVNLEQGFIRITPLDGLLEQ